MPKVKPAQSVKAAVVRPVATKATLSVKPQTVSKPATDTIAKKFQAAGQKVAQSIFKAIPTGTSPRSVGRISGMSRAFGSIGRAMRSMPSGRMGRSMGSTYGSKKKGSAY